MPNLLDNLISHWSFSETVGPTFADDKGINPLTASGVTFGAVGIIGNAGSYDGVNDNAKITDAAQVGLDPGTSSFTLNIWFKTSDVTSGAKFLVGKSINAVAPGGGYVIFAGNGTVECDMNDGTTTKN